jgi:hypothetical protein
MHAFTSQMILAPFIITAVKTSNLIMKIYHFAFISLLLVFLIISVYFSLIRVSRRPPLCLVVRVLCHRSRGPGSIPGTTKKKVLGLERGLLSFVSTTEELLDIKVAAPV